MNNSVAATPIQKIGLTPRNRLAAQSDRPTGTALWTGNVLHVPADDSDHDLARREGDDQRVQLESTDEDPVHQPDEAAAPTAARIAIQIRLSDCSPTPAMIIAASVRVPGVLRSMPPVMITNIWPRAVIASRHRTGRC